MFVRSLLNREKWKKKGGKLLVSVETIKEVTVKMGLNRFVPKDELENQKKKKSENVGQICGVIFMSSAP